MTDRIVDLFDANKISPNLQRSSGSGSSEPLYFAGGYAGSLADLQERNEAEPIGKQVGGRRTRNRKARRRRSSYRRRLSLQRQSTYRRRLSLQRQSTYRRRLSLQRQSTYRRR
jgi:hypothetical protein